MLIMNGVKANMFLYCKVMALQSLKARKPRGSSILTEKVWLKTHKRKIQKSVGFFWKKSLLYVFKGILRLATLFYLVRSPSHVIVIWRRPYEVYPCKNWNFHLWVGIITLWCPTRKNFFLVPWKPTLKKVFFTKENSAFNKYKKDCYSVRFSTCWNSRNKTVNNKLWFVKHARER